MRLFSLDYLFVQYFVHPNPLPLGLVCVPYHVQYFRTLHPGVKDRDADISLTNKQAQLPH